MLSSEKLSTTGWCVSLETSLPPWQLLPHSTANYGCSSLNTVLENKEKQELIVLLLRLLPIVTIAAWLARTSKDYRVRTEGKKYTAVLADEPPGGDVFLAARTRVTLFNMYYDVSRSPAGPWCSAWHVPNHLEDSGRAVTNCQDSFGIVQTSVLCFLL